MLLEVHVEKKTQNLDELIAQNAWTQDGVARAEIIKDFTFFSPSIGLVQVESRPRGEQVYRLITDPDLQEKIAPKKLTWTKIIDALTFRASRRF